MYLPGKLPWSLCDQIMIQTDVCKVKFVNKESLLQVCSCYFKISSLADRSESLTSNHKSRLRFPILTLVFPSKLGVVRNSLVPLGLLGICLTEK